VDGIPKPILNKGYVRVPEGPGLGIPLNEEAIKQHLVDKNYFDPTPEWNNERSGDQTWS
jgi:hypothetical protein